MVIYRTFDFRIYFIIFQLSEDCINWRPGAHARIRLKANVVPHKHLKIKGSPKSEACTSKRMRFIESEESTTSMPSTSNRVISKTLYSHAGTQTMQTELVESATQCKITYTNNKSVQVKPNFLDKSTMTKTAPKLQTPMPGPSTNIFSSPSGRFSLSSVTSSSDFLASPSRSGSL